MGQVAGQVERDRAIYQEWVDGARQSDLAERYGVSQPAISQAIGRVLDQLPAQDKAAEIRRTLDLVDELVLVYAPKAKAGDPAASREVRGLLALRGRFLGVDRRTVEHTGQVEHAHSWTPGPSVAEVLDQFRAEGLIRPRAELVRLDPGEAGP